MVTMKDLSTKAKVRWCPGCGNFAILIAFKRTLIELQIEPERVVAVAGIGCHGRIVDYINVNSIHTIHGRVIPIATGIKLANKDLMVVGFAGDGDAYAIGLGHLPHAARRNIDIKYIVHDNMVFGLTTGQVAPTSPKGMKTRSTPYGSVEEPLNPIAFALACGCTFVARGFSGELEHLKEIFKRALTHRGFAFVDVLQPCVAFNNTYEYFRKRVYKLEEVGHDPTDFKLAMKRALEWGDRVPIGVFYSVEKPTLEDEIPQLCGTPLTLRNISNIDITPAYTYLR